MEITPTTVDAYDLLHRGSLALGKAERNGIRVDLDYYRSISVHVTRQISHLTKKLQDSELISYWKRKYGTQFNMGSNEQLQDILYSPEHFNIKPNSFTDGKCKRCKGEGCDFCLGTGRNPSVDAEALGTIQLAEIADMLKIKTLTNARDTFVGNLVKEQVDGVVHTNFNLNIAKSYRPSTSNPNLANVPKRNGDLKSIVRKGIKARPGHKLVCCDFKGVEVATGCPYHKDEKMIEYVTDKTTDMHRDAAMRLYFLDKADAAQGNIRHSGKNEFVFPQFYGDWWKSCAVNLWNSAFGYRLLDGTPLVEHLAKHKFRSLIEFEKHVESVEDWLWNKNFIRYTAWKKEWWEDYQSRGYFDMLTGFRCGGSIMNRKQACNYPIQGTAFHLMLNVIVWVDQFLTDNNFDSFICNQIYDDLMLDIHPEEEKEVVDYVKYCVEEKLPERYDWINVPLEIDIEATPVDGSWYEKSKEWVFK